MSHNQKIEKYIKLLKFISQTTDDYKYLWDIRNRCGWFFGCDLKEKFSSKLNELTPVTVEEYLSIVDQRDSEELIEDLTKIRLGEKKEHNLNYRWVAIDGTREWFKCSGKVLEGEDGRPMALVGTISSKTLENKINRITGLPNKTVLMQDLKKKKQSEKVGKLMLVGLDRIAKTFSENNGEYVEKLIDWCGNILDDYIQEGVSVYHIEDDTFAICMENIDEEKAKLFFEDLSERLSEKITITAIVMSLTKILVDEKEMIKMAINELVNAKKINRSKLTLLSREELDDRLDKLNLFEELQKSVSNDFEGFYVTYQPQIQHGTFEIIGVEALIRYKSKKTGKEYMPVDFIPLMEQAGLMAEADLWVLKQATEKLKEWRKSLPNLRLNVNFSLFELKKGIGEVIYIFKNSGLPKNSVLIELTETVSMDEVENVSFLTRSLKEAGIGTSIDDFGTGYSNLALLKEISCDEIKVEKTFVTGITEGSYGYLLVNSLIQFSKNNNIRVCCEGTESEEDILTLARLKPDLYQGYAFDKPCTAEYFEKCYIEEGTREYKKRKNFAMLLRRKEREHIANFDPKEILSSVEVGLCVMESDLGNNVYEMHPDEVTEKLLEIKEDLSPLECNDFWFSRIKKEYVNFVKRSLDRLISSENVLQFVYPWIHPTRGEILLSFSGVRTHSEGNKLVVKCLFRAVTDIERLTETASGRSLRTYIQNKYVDAMLDKAIAFMEINLSQNKVDGGIRDIIGIQPTKDKYPKNIIDDNGSLFYDEFEQWFAENYLLSDKEDFLAKNNRQFLMDSFISGNPFLEFFYHCKNRHGGSYVCRKVFYIGKDELMGDVTALCVIYDASEVVKKRIEQENKDNIIRSISDEFRSIIYVNLDDDTYEFYREDVSVMGWRAGVTSYDQMIGAFANQFVTESDNLNYKYMLSRAVIKNKLQNQDMFKFEYERKCSDGSVRCHEVKVQRDNNNEFGFYVVVGVKDIEKDVRLRRELQQALEMAHTDHLTGLYNQQGLKIKCTELLKNQNSKSALIFMDLDNFKFVNDMYGHSMGDKVLFEVGKILKEETRGKDIIGRYGGDEFIVLINDSKDIDDDNGVLERIQERISRVCDSVGLDVHITASMGVSFTEQIGYDYRFLKEIADDRLYIAKKNGKNKAVKIS